MKKFNLILRLVIALVLVFYAFEFFSFIENVDIEKQDSFAYNATRIFATLLLIPCTALAVLVIVRDTWGHVSWSVITGAFCQLILISIQIALDSSALHVLVNVLSLLLIIIAAILYTVFFRGNSAYLQE